MAEAPAAAALGAGLLPAPADAAEAPAAEPDLGLAGRSGYLELSGGVLLVSGPDRSGQLGAEAELAALDRALAALGAGGRVVVDCHKLGDPTCLAQIARFQAAADIWSLHGRPALQLLGPSRIHVAILRTLGLWYGE